MHKCSKYGYAKICGIHIQTQCYFGSYVIGVLTLRAPLLFLQGFV